jgi:hypothetical protein
LSMGSIMQSDSRRHGDRGTTGAWPASSICRRMRSLAEVWTRPQRPCPAPLHAVTSRHLRRPSAARRTARGRLPRLLTTLTSCTPFSPHSPLEPRPEPWDGGTLASVSGRCVIGQAQLYDRSSFVAPRTPERRRKGEGGVRGDGAAALEQRR